VPVEQPLYPVNLILTGRRCVVVGGGAVAARKVDGLVAAGAVVDVVATVVGGEIRADGAWLAVVATDDPATNRRVHEDGEAAGIWVNAADDPASCAFILPAVVRQGPLMVTVSTSGYSPALATWLKAHVASELGPEFATFAEMLAEARAEVRAAGRSTEDVDWRPVMDWSMLELIKAGQSAQVRERLQACLSSS
jgi:siroheme synthase-like protein